MDLRQIVFCNRSGKELEGILELPAGRKPHNFAVLLHCFDIKVQENIRKNLVSKGFGVLSMDLAELASNPESDYVAAETDFLDAVAYLENIHKAPALLVGHSLGGALVLLIAGSLPATKAVALLGTPSNSLHLKRLLMPDASGESHAGMPIQLGEKAFSLETGIVEELLRGGLVERVKRLRIPLLFLHSPQDALVEILNSEALYSAARYPKSFIALEGADHFLSHLSAATYAGELISAWALGYMSIPSVSGPESEHQVVASLDQNDDFSTTLRLGNHYLTADEPIAAGGKDLGPSPYALLSGSLAACTAMTLRMYASRKGWDLSKVEVHISYSRQHQQDCGDCESPEAKIDTFERTLKLSGQLSTEQRARLLEIADKCPVHKTLHTPTQVITTLGE